MKRKRTYEAAIMQLPDGTYTGQVLEHRAALSQGKTIKEIKENLTDALKEVLDDYLQESEAGVKAREKKYKIIRTKISY